MGENGLPEHILRSAPSFLRISCSVKAGSAVVIHSSVQQVDIHAHSFCVRGSGVMLRWKSA